jgi:uncharacterized protein YukE
VLDPIGAACTEGTDRIAPQRDRRVIVMGKSGMEIAAIRSLARTMDDRAGEIDRLLAKASAEVNDLNWQGADRDRFVHEWEGTHAAHLRRVATGLRQAANDARRKAAEQERVSQAHGGSGTGGGGGGGSGW